ncbi:hypothetical protein LSCM1_04185 [Leishmania martiniquensis]|uniref:Uncharacterized protein n=1 Tax=Leishmania martiniquensis TaxID=1580590 RepID=A0A836H7L6_9TRYP|nr:hypothetical protein LSCM1_04185 [Leishmania martiniquensis]
MPTDTFSAREALGVPPVRAEEKLPRSLASTPKAAAGSRVGEGAEPSVECAAATSKQLKATLLEAGVKPVPHYARRRPRCCTDAGGALLTPRSERSFCARQGCTPDTEESASWPTIGIGVQELASGAAHGAAANSGAGDAGMPSVSGQSLQDATPHRGNSDLGNASVPTLAVGTTDCIRCAEVSPVTAAEIWVPTQFTTAAGRAICVRERRLLTVDSPYWKLLRFDPAREAIVAPPDLSIGECGCDDGDSRELFDIMLSAKRETEQLPCDAAAELGGAIGQSLYEGSARTVPPLTSTSAGYVLPYPCVRRQRAASCPERVVGSPPYSSIGEGTVYSLPPFSGFCAADGRPFYCRCSYASAERQGRQQSRADYAEGA